MKFFILSVLITSCTAKEAVKIEKKCNKTINATTGKAIDCNSEQYVAFLVGAMDFYNSRPTNSWWQVNSTQHFQLLQVLKKIETT